MERLWWHTIIQEQLVIRERCNDATVQQLGTSSHDE